MLSVGIRQNNHVHELVTLTGKVNIEARNIFQSVLVKLQGPNTLNAEATHTGIKHQYLHVSSPSSSIAVCGTKLWCLSRIWATQ